MKFSRRVVIGILFIVVFLLLGMFFWPFILDNIITPTALAIWLLLRIFILSIDQKYYWGAIIIVVFVLLFRLLAQDLITEPSGDFPTANEAISNIGHWRSIFIIAADGIRDEKFLKQKLINLLLSFYASKHHTSTNYLLYEALQRGELPLPEQIFTFLFPDEPEKSKRSLSKLLQSVQAAPRKWMRRWTGQETAEHYQMIDEVLRFIETSMEVKNDDGKFKTNEN
jgi:hypothetical protein